MSQTLRQRQALKHLCRTLRLPPRRVHCDPELHAGPHQPLQLRELQLPAAERMSLRLAALVAICMFAVTVCIAASLLS